MRRLTDVVWLTGLCALWLGGSLSAHGSSSRTAVLFKVADRFEARATGGGFTVEGLEFDAEVAALFRRCEVRPAFDQPRALLDRWWREADERLPAHLERPGRLANWFEARWRGPASVHDAEMYWLPVELADLPFVEDAFLEPVVTVTGESSMPAGPPQDPGEPTPDFRPLQAWFEPAPVGFGLAPLRALDGVRGDRMRLFHIEADWDVDHEDLPSLDKNSLIHTPPPEVAPSRNHGTGVLGVLFGGDNGIGVTGIADQAEGLLLCATVSGGFHKAFAEVIELGEPGDVIVLIGQQNIGIQHSGDFVPIEIFRVFFDAILTATTQGFYVLEAAGNGENDLDSPRFQGLFDRSVRDSGAILVTASEGADPEPAWIANYGSRCDATGYGNQVVTTGYGGLFRTGDPHRAYTDQYAGTSAGTATVSGVAMAVLGAMRTQGLPMPTPSELRDLLQVGGTTIRGGLPPRPNLEAILRSVGLPRGLITGSEHWAGPVELRFPGFAGRPGVVLAATSSRPAGAGSSGLDTPLLLDPESLWLAFSRAELPDALVFDVPPIPSLLGHRFYSQVLSRRPDGSFELSSSIDVEVTG